jgi:hypothetical protein
MPHAILTNRNPPTAPATSAPTDAFFAFWVLTRGLLAAGWKYKGSGDATAGGTKSTDGNFLNEKWGVGGGVALNSNAQTGFSSDAMTANNDGTVTHVITGATFSSTLSPGRFLTISGAANAVNNGTFRIVSFTSATTVKVWNPASTTETTVVTWTEKQGGANGSITAVSTGGATVGRSIFAVSSGTPFVASVAFPVVRGSVGDRITIAGATTGANNGTFMITRVISSTSVEIDNASATTDASNGSLVWSECSPTQQTYPLSITGATGNGAWIDLQGPSTLKVFIGTNVPSGAFLTNELVTQTTSGATGTILGCVTDTGGGLGFLVVEPRLNGTGGGVRGWTTGGTDTITGGASGVTVTSANVATIELVRELVIWKNTGALGHCWTQVVDNAAENASRFSVLAAAAGVTNTVAPGGPTGTFPAAGSYVLFGTGGSNAAGTGTTQWHNAYSGLTYGGAVHALCANCIEDSTHSADGSWTLLQGALSSAVGLYICTAWMHVDGSEDGDLDPYVAFVYNASAVNSATRTVFVSAAFQSGPILYTGTIGTALVTCGRGWRRRTFASADAYQDFGFGQLCSNAPFNNSNQTYPYKVANHPNNNMPTREALYVASFQSGQKMRKGYSRWWFATEGGPCNRLLFNGAFIQLAPAIVTGAAAGPIVVGPWDGATLPNLGM